MKVLEALVRIIGGVNDRVLRLGRGLGCIALALTVIAILLQVYYRYVLNNALPWPEEAARALMIWMMAMVAPTAYRQAGFVSIDWLPDLLPKRLREVLNFAILSLCTLVIIIMLQQAWGHFTAPLLFDSSGLNRLLQDSGINQWLGTDLHFKTAYIYLAMSVLLVAMLLVSLELFVRQIARWLGLAPSDFQGNETGETETSPTDREHSQPIKPGGV